MKPILLISATLFFSIISFAQGQKKEHLSFKGVPIDGKLSQFILKMKQNGFVYIQTTNGMALLNGDFAGYKNCYVSVSTLKASDLVYKVTVVFKGRETWSTLLGNYVSLKELLSEKYGNPIDVLEKFDLNPYMEPKTDKDKLLQVKAGNCMYFSIWETDKGNVELSIERDDSKRCFVRLRYFDKINGEVVRANAKDDL